MMTMERKIQKANENFNLTKGEIKKVQAAAMKRTGKLNRVTGWFSAGYDEWGFRKVICEVCGYGTGDRLDDVVIHCCLFDRRMSFVQ